MHSFFCRFYSIIYLNYISIHVHCSSPFFPVLFPIFLFLNKCDPAVYCNKKVWKKTEEVQSSFPKTETRQRAYKSILCMKRSLLWKSSMSGRIMHHSAWCMEVIIIFHFTMNHLEYTQLRQKLIIISRHSDYYLAKKKKKPLSYNC